MEKEKIAIDRFLEAQDSLVIQQSDFSLKTVSQMVDNNAIDLAPHYQRRDRWKVKKQSELIESFILNVPVPPVYFAEEDYGSYSVIDGKQRITSISNYLNGQFKLTGLKKFAELNGLYFEELPNQIKNALSIRPYVRVVTLLRQSDPNLKFEVFLRLNTGGESLEAQEIRNVAFAGPLNDLLYELSENDILKRKLKISSAKSNAYRKMKDLEHVLRFFTLLENWENMGSVLASAMDDYMKENQNISEHKLNKLKREFNKSIDNCEKIWPNTAFFKPQGNTWRDQLISPLYDAQMIAVSMLDAAEISSLISQNSKAKKLIRELYNDNEEFLKAVSQATNNRANIIARISILYKSLQEIA